MAADDSAETGRHSRRAESRRRARLEGICRPDAILATNTSAISITEIAAATSTAERVVGMHFFNPAPVLPLVEVIVGDRTSATVAERVREFAEAIGKRPVEFGESRMIEPRQLQFRGPDRN